MQDIQTQVIQTYQNNLLFFQEKFPELYTKIDLLSQAISSGQYKENYSLEYKNGYFDLLEIKSGHYLYGKSSIQLAQETAKETDLTKTKGVIETFYNYSFTDKAVELAEDSDPTTSQFVLTAPVVSFVTNLISKENSLMKQIYKFIFFGVGLGLHLETIERKTNPYMYLIIEDNLEIFRLSLFTTNYAELAKKGELFFSVMENDAGLKQIFDKFYHLSFIRNNYIKYSLFYPEYRKKISLIQNFIITQSNLTYQQDKLLLKNTKVLHSIEKEYKFFDQSQHYSQTPFSHKPVILVAAGPSLMQNIEWLQKNAAHALVVAVFMTLPILEEHNITPDVIVHIDENMQIIQNTMHRLKNKNFINNIPLFLAPSIECDYFLEFTNKENLYLFEDRTRYRFEYGFLETFSVGETLYALSLLWDTHDLYLLGLDLALDSETGASHAKGHASHNDTNNLQDATENENVTLRDSTFLVQGNLNDIVQTTPLFDMSRRMMDTFGEKYKQAHQKVYNIGNGAFFQHTIPIEAKDINFSKLDKKDDIAHQSIQDFFNKHASSNLSALEQATFKLRLNDANNKKEKILIFSKQKAPSLNQFHNLFTTLASELITTPSEHFNELAQVYIIYLENIGGYIGDFFNTQGIENPKRNIKKFQKIMTQQFLKIVDKYLESLEKVEF